MLFSSSIFLFRFLPLVLGVYFVLGRHSFRNAWLLIASLAFYAWGEPVMTGVMLFSIVANYGFGLWVDSSTKRGGGKLALGVAVAANIALIVAFKYADWLWSLASDAAIALHAAHRPFAQLSTALHFSAGLRAALCTDSGAIRLPIGISFFTFQAMSYVIDVHRREGPVLRNPIDFGLYKSLFPQLIAGPIVRYKDVAAQIAERSVSRADFALGVRRFVIGLAKKMLIANYASEIADRIFALKPSELHASIAWLGIVSYTLQIYFDFSGYSDMAIGLGRMFGFHFLENFEHPYVSRSITEFWRRWHISLSSWFRDYLYIPLGGNRRGKLRTYLNLLTVFALCGLWHGASASFLVWGLFHGAFLVLERVGLGAWLERKSSILRHVYVMFLVMIGWVFFRADGIEHAIRFVGAMFGASSADPRIHSVATYVFPLHALALVAGVVGATPWVAALRSRLAAREARGESRGLGAWMIAAHVALLAMFVGSILAVASGTHNPFIYFRF